MSALTGPILCFLVLGVLYFIDYFLPTWLGTVPGIAYLFFIVFLMYTRGWSHFVGLLIVLLVGELIINGIWITSIENRKKKIQKELEIMKAKDLS
ncbi:hypothetical protein [Leuconostoc carnosum]|uniref:hypothetical protein n=1 Tax=Leuconostoc carnosum TaxID=1252 RepID=UPI00272E26E8|nr:hypothetical protein [Leuconostoc carnosum]WLC97074.1 hypothetical protein Q5R05_05240 [Leuconostoc carnosum]